MAILKADPKTRRVFIIVSLISIIILCWGFIEFDAFIKQKSRQEALIILGNLLSLTFLSCLPLAIYFYYFGNRIIKAGQFPLPGAKLLLDKEIITGEKALRKGRILKKMSIVLVLSGLYCSIYFFFFTERFVLLSKEIIKKIF